MNTQTNFIIVKGKVSTAEIKNIYCDISSQKWSITFNNGKRYNYRNENVIWLQNPKRLNPEDYKISHNGTILFRIAEICSFKHGNVEYWHIGYLNGRELNCNAAELKIERSCLKEQKTESVFEYLKKVAAYTSVKTEEDVAILQHEYEKIKFIGKDTIASAYLDVGKYEKSAKPKTYTPIFPFGCNLSQYQAVVNALSNDISIIEGPPGTGKTQTILNIIANLVLQGKTVQVVSNNNSAIENVIEKLNSREYNLGFIAAMLGKKENKEKFIAHQNNQYLNIYNWISDISVSEQSKELKAIFENQIAIAGLKQEKYDAELEYEHFNRQLSNIKINTDEFTINKKLDSKKLMRIWQEFQDFTDMERKPGWFYRFRFLLSNGFKYKQLEKAGVGPVLEFIHREYYRARIAELNKEITEKEAWLEQKNAEQLKKDLTRNSLIYFRSELARRYSGSTRKVFGINDLWKQPNDFLKEYPVILSTTYTARSSLGPNAEFDYVIMDEASQVDVATGLLSLSNAKRAVIVGDTKQLPNIVTSQQKTVLNEIYRRSGVAEAYNYTNHSFLESVSLVFGDKAPNVLLSEHYRCDPQIINFCNQKFYNNELVIMTERGSQSPLKLYLTVEGEHRRDRMNQRQIDVIKNEIMPYINCSADEIGIIAPYRNQVAKLREELGTKIDISTVHKFQGREKDVIILSTVDDIVTEFSDDPNLLNVAISRAKKQLIVVTSASPQPAGSNIGDLIDYIQYNNCDIVESKINSVFDYLYKNYETARLDYLKKYRRISEYDSENLMYTLIRDVLKEMDDSALALTCHESLNLLFKDLYGLSPGAAAFINTGLSHLDFLIYNKVSKKPVLAVEVDGFTYHKEGTRQYERDKIKDYILDYFGIPLIRFKTNGSGEKEALKNKLNECLKK